MTDQQALFSAAKSAKKTTANRVLSDETLVYHRAYLARWNAMMDTLMARHERGEALTAQEARLVSNRQSRVMAGQAKGLNREAA